MYHIKNTFIRIKIFLRYFFFWLTEKGNWQNQSVLQQNFPINCCISLAVSFITGNIHSVFSVRNIHPLLCFQSLTLFVNIFWIIIHFLPLTTNLNSKSVWCLELLKKTTQGTTTRKAQSRCFIKLIFFKMGTYPYIFFPLKIFTSFRMLQLWERMFS